MPVRTDIAHALVDLYRLMKRATDNLAMLTPHRALLMLTMIENAADDISRYVEPEGEPGEHP